MAMDVVRNASAIDRKSTRLNSSHGYISYAVFCLKKMIVPGPGAEIYRGLGAVIGGGILVSQLFTLVLMPAMLRLGERSEYFFNDPATPKLCTLSLHHALPI